MVNQNGSGVEGRRLLARFWQSASLFWRGETGGTAWVLTTSLIMIVFVQLMVQYRLNYWNRDFFNALERRDGAMLWLQALVFFPLMASSIALAALSVWGRMTAQRKWREALTSHLIAQWLGKEHYHQLNYMANGIENPEYRIAEDARIATDAPIDLTLALLSSFVTALAFFEVLWTVGGNMTVSAFGFTLTIPGYLVLGVIVYSSAVTAAMLRMGRPLTAVIQNKNQAEAEMRAAANLLREAGEGMALAGDESDERRALWNSLGRVLEQWRDLCWQLVRLTLVSHGNTLLGPAVAWFLCAPKYLAGTMTLGELTQAAAAFVTVQVAFNWLVDNYQRLADWRSSANRVATLLVALDKLGPTGRPTRDEALAPADLLKQAP